MTNAKHALTSVTGIRKLGPLGISVANLARSALFYAGLGFNVGDRTVLPHSAAKALGANNADAKLSMQKVTRDGVELLLLELHPRPPLTAGDGAVRQFGIAHLELLVDDVDSVGSGIAQLGGTVLKETHTRLTDVGPSPIHMLFCRDPDGTLILLVAS